MELLGWIERLDVVGFEPLMLAHLLSARATYSHIERLERAGLVNRIYDRGGSVVAITARGRRTARPELSEARPVSQALSRGLLLNHARAVSWVVANLTLRDLSWVSDREMRSLREWQVEFGVLSRHRHRHRPDIGYVDDQGMVAMEVELTAKSASRLKAILEAYVLSSRYDGRPRQVGYITDHSGVQRAVQRAAKAAGASHLVAYAELDKLQDATRQGAVNLAGAARRDEEG